MFCNTSQHSPRSRDLYMNLKQINKNFTQSEPSSAMLKNNISKTSQMNKRASIKSQQEAERHAQIVYREYNTPIKISDLYA